MPPSLRSHRHKGDSSPSPDRTAQCYPHLIDARPTPVRDRPKNRLFYGDNLQVLRGHDAQGRSNIPSESVDLIYLDPPFNSRQDYNVLFAERDGTRSASQITAL